jgi:hypothetical protein
MINLKTDTMAKVTLVFLIVLGLVMIIVTPALWPWVVGYWALIAGIAYLKRNSP